MIAVHRATRSPPPENLRLEALLGERDHLLIHISLARDSTPTDEGYIAPKGV
jgi:hypothetical protein